MGILVQRLRLAGCCFGAWPVDSSMTCGLVGSHREAGGVSLNAQARSQYGKLGAEVKGRKIQTDPLPTVATKPDALKVN